VFIGEEIMDRRLIVLALGAFALGTGSFVVAGVLPQISHTFHVAVGAAGQLTTVFALVFAVMSPVLAAALASVSRKVLLLLGLGIYVVANLATALVPTLEWALLTRALAGLGGAMFMPTALGAASSTVPPERRGFALSIVTAGLTAATALGSPIGAMIGGFTDWRWTMVFVSALGVACGLGVSILLAHVAVPPKVSLAHRIAPLANRGIGLMLLTMLLAAAGGFTAYTYFSVVLDRVINGNPGIMGGLLVLWGVAGTIANLFSGRLIDKIGPRKVILTMLVIFAIDMATLSWTGATLLTALASVAVWGACGWGILVPQQHRLVASAPTTAPVVLALSSSATYLGVSAGGLLGAAGIALVGSHNLGLVSCILIVFALVASEFAVNRQRDVLESTTAY